MTIKVYKVRHFMSKSRRVICLNGVPIAVCRGSRTTSNIVAYLEGYDVTINDGKLKRDLDKAKALFTKEE